MAQGLTKTTVDRLKGTGRDYVSWDETLSGFGVRVSSRGVKSYILMYRAGRGRAARLRKLTIAKVGTLTISEARNIALQYRGEIAKGLDPAKESAAKRRELTLKQAADRYLKEYVQVHNKASWASQIELLLNVHILPRFGSCRVSEIDRADIIRWHAAKPAGHYGTNRCLAVLRKILTIASRDWGAIPSNPATGIRMHREEVRNRYFTDAELRAIGTWLEEANELPHFVLATKLLLLTGMRLGETLALTWKDVDLDKELLILKDSKNGARNVALNSEALLLLRSSCNSGDFVAGSHDGKVKLTKGSYHAFWRRLKTGASLVNARPHDIRHTVATLGARMGGNAFILRDLLGHKTIAVTSGYVARNLDPVRTLSDAIGSHIQTVTNRSSKK